MVKKRNEKKKRKEKLSPFKPLIGSEEADEMLDSLKSGWITTGPKVKKFEQKIRKYIGCKNAISVNSCTSALHLSLVANNISKGDEVITTPFTFISTANVIIHQGAKPVFADIDEETYNINPKEIEDKITDRTKAILPVDFAGQPCEIDDIKKIAKKNDLLIIEDAAHSLGAKYRSKKIGTICDITCFSFYATKNLTTAEGGMITTNNDELAEKFKIMRLHGMSKDAWKRYSSKGSWYYEVVFPGFKYNMTDLQAALGIHQLEKFEEMQKRRHQIAKMYNNEFDEIPEVVTPFVKKYVTHAWHLYPIQISKEKLKIGRNRFIEELKKEKIGSSVHFIPVHMHQYYKKRYGYIDTDFPNAKRVYEREISLPLYPKMTDEDVNDVIHAVKKIVKKYRM